MAPGGKSQRYPTEGRHLREPDQPENSLILSYKKIKKYVRIIEDMESDNNV